MDSRSTNNETKEIRVTIQDDIRNAGVILGSATIGDVLVAFAQCPNTDGSPWHWYLGAGQDGAVVARTWSQGPLVPSNAKPTRDEIEARLREALVDPLRDHQLSSASAMGFHPRYVVDHIRLAMGLGHDDTNVELTARISDVYQEFLEPLRNRLGELRLFLASGPAAGKEAAFWLTMTEAQVEGLQRFIVARPWLGDLTRWTAHVDYSKAPEEIELAMLERNGLPSALLRQLGPASVNFDKDCAVVAAAVPLDWMPRAGDEREWAAFRLVADMIGDKGCLASSIPTLLAPVKGRWAAYFERLARVLDLDGEAVIDQAVRHEKGFLPALPGDRADDAIDMIRELDGWLQDNVDADMEAGIEDDPGPSAVRMLVGDRSLGRLLEISRQWHADPLFHESHAGRENVAWDALLPDHVDEATGIQVKVLTNSLELGEEGSRGLDRDDRKGLAHCVGGQGFVAGSLRNLLRIVSLRRDGERLSTAQLDLGEDFGVAQHRGWMNAEPSADARAALDAYVKIPEVAEAARLVQPLPMDSIPVVAQDPLSPEIGLERWRPYLAGGFREMDLEGLTEDLDGNRPGTIAP